MKKVIDFVNIIFSIISIILLISLIYIGVTKEFSITVIVSIVVMLWVGIHSTVELLRSKGNWYGVHINRSERTV